MLQEKEKGKNLDLAECQLTLKNHNPGCMWGILHHFQHNRWNVVKRLPHKRLVGYGKHSTTDQGRSKTKTTRDDDDDKSDQRKSKTKSSPDDDKTDKGKTKTSTRDEDKVQENVESSTVETKGVVPSSSPHKSSMKSRIKALIIDDKRRQKERHRRTSTYPIRKPADGAAQIQEKEKSESPRQNDDLCTSSPRNQNVLAKTSEESSGNGVGTCECCDTMLKVNYVKQNDLGTQPVRDHTLLHGNSIYAVEPSKCDAIQESKLFMDALDLLNVREEVFLKILQDPTSSLANNQLQFRQAPNLRLGLSKSISFAVTPKREFGDDEGCCVDDKDKHASVEGDCVDNKGQNGSQEEEKQVKKNADSKGGIKGFKNLGARIRHVIRDKKKEKNRILKDAVQDKIPCDRSVSKNDGQTGTDFGQSAMKSFKRTSSFNDSFDRYNQLLEISINKDAKDHVSDKLRFKTCHADDTEVSIRKNHTKLGRIFSLPDLRSYSSTQIDDSTSNSPLVVLDTVVINEQKSVVLDSNNESQENMVDIGGDFEELVILKEAESDSSGVLSVEHVLVPAPHSPKFDEVPEEDDEFVHEIEVCEDSNSPTILQDLAYTEQGMIQQDLDYTEQDMIQQDLAYSEQDMIDIDTQESDIQQFYDDLMYTNKVDEKNLAEYNYVRDVLELSGFSRDAFLGKWQSEEQLLNPSIFEQVEGCLVDQSECEQMFTNSDHALLFDMINEVLLGIHERSFCYWPRSLTSLSRLHRLPKGNRILEEVWAEIRWLLSWQPEGDQAMDEAVSRDMAKDDGWMNLQLDAECVVIKLEDMIFDDLMDEIIAE